MLVASFIGFLQFGHMLSWWADTDFRNESGEDIEITPIGIVEGGEHIGPLFDMYKTWWFQKVKNANIHVKTNESRMITYDMDDQNLQFVIVKYQDQTMQILKLDAEIWENSSYEGCCRDPVLNSYTIPPRSQMPECPEILKPATNGEYIEITDELIQILNDIPEATNIQSK